MLTYIKNQTYFNVLDNTFFCLGVIVSIFKKDISQYPHLYDSNLYEIHIYSEKQLKDI